MGKFIGIFACFVIVILDVIAGILGLKAEAAQKQEKHLRLWIFECREPSHDAFVLGLAAATLLCVAHVVANLVGGCSSACTQDEFQRATPSKKLSVACLVFTWIIVGVGLSMLVTGTISNKKSRSGSCGFTHHHFLSLGGILCMLHAFFSVAYYVTSSSTDMSVLCSLPK